MASTTDHSRTKEQYVETFRDRKVQHPRMDSGDMIAYATGHLRAVAVREGHAEEVAILDALAEVLGW